MSPLAVQAEHAAYGTAGREGNLAFLKITQLRRVSVKSPSKAIAGDGLDCLVAVFHHDDVGLVVDLWIALRSDAELDLGFGKRMRVHGVNTVASRCSLGSKTSMLPPLLERTAGLGELWERSSLGGAGCLHAPSSSKVASRPRKAVLQNMRAFGRRAAHLPAGFIRGLPALQQALR